RPASGCEPGGQHPARHPGRAPASSPLVGISRRRRLLGRTCPPHAPNPPACLAPGPADHSGRPWPLNILLLGETIRPALRSNRTMMRSSLFRRSRRTVLFLCAVVVVPWLAAAEHTFKTSNTLAAEASTLIKLLETAHYNRAAIHSSDY